MRLVVEGRFATCMQTVASLLKASDISKSVCFTVEGNILYITVVTNLVYQAAVHIIHNDSVTDTTLTVRILPVMSLFKPTQPVELVFHNDTVRIIQDRAECLCSHSDAIITKRSFPAKETAKSLSTATLLEAIRVLGNANALKKTLRMEKPIVFYGDYAVMAYPTMYIKTMASGIHTAMSVEDAKRVAAFSPTHFIEDDAITFYSGSDVLQVPRTSVTALSNFDVLKSTLDKSIKLMSADFVQTLRDIAKALPGQDVTLGFYADGGCVATVTSVSESVTVTLAVTQQATPEVVLTAPIDNIILAFNLLGDSTINIFYKEVEKVCLCTTATAILMSLR